MKLSYLSTIEVETGFINKNCMSKIYVSFRYYFLPERRDIKISYIIAYPGD